MQKWNTLKSEFLFNDETNLISKGKRPTSTLLAQRIQLFDKYNTSEFEFLFDNES